MDSIRRPRRWLILSLAALGALGAGVGCSSSGGGDQGGTGGRGSGGAASDAGAGSGGRGSGGAPGAGGSPGTGGAAVDAGSGSGGRGTGGAATDAGVADASPDGSSDGGATLTLTSPAFTEGAMIPAVVTCTASSNQSPALDWTAGPAGTMSYAIVLTNLTNSLIHWVLWDIPAATTSLPAMLPADATLASPAGAKQSNFNSGGHAFQGPCPGGTFHTYQFQVRALDVATLPGLTTASTPMQVRTQLLAHSLALGNLTGMSNASR